MEAKDCAFDADGIFKELESRKKTETSFYEFIKQAWNEIEMGTPFVGGWYLEGLAEHLEALYRGDIQDLLINVPPRTGKSTLTSAAFPAWVWAHNPSVQFLALSHSQDLALEAALKHRYIVTSEWYQMRWGDQFQLMDDQNTKGKFSNSRSGYRSSSSILAKSTGKGANILIVDDPNNALESDVDREAVNKRWDAVLSTRLNDMAKDKRLVIQQRTHENDLTGHILAGEDAKDWVTYIIPMEFEKARRCKTIILPSTKGKVWRDPRTKEGESLCSVRFPDKIIKKLKAKLRSQYSISGQLQQRPSPEEGGIIKKGWFKLWAHEKPPKLLSIIQSWDTALSEKEQASYSACTTWGLFNDDNHITNLILLNLWRGRVEYPELRRLATLMYHDFRNDGELDIIPDGKHVPDMVLIEAKASGSPLIQDLRRAGIMATKFDPTPLGDKIQRVKLVTHMIEGGRIWVPAKPPSFTQMRKYADTLVELCAVFPNSDARDVVDTMTQVIHRVLMSGDIRHPSDPKTVSRRREVNPYQVK